MLVLNNIPHLRAYKQKVYMPRDQQSSTLYNIAFSNNKSTDDIINLMKHPMLVTNSKYMTYFIEPIYRQKVYNRFFNINYRSKAKEIHNVIKSQFSMYRTPMEFTQVANRNLYYDMQVFNNIFFENVKNLSIQKKIGLYFDYLKTIINRPQFNEYKLKMVFIDVESWYKSTDKVNNPITYLLLAFRKYFDEFKALGNIDFYLYSDNTILKINPSLCNQQDISIFKRELNKLTRTIDFEDDIAIDTTVEKQEVKDNISKDLNDRYGFTANLHTPTTYIDETDPLLDPETANGVDGDEPDDALEPVKTAINQKINDTLDEISDEEPILDQKEIEDKLHQRLDEDKELIKFMHDTIKEKKTGKSTASLKRDAELREKQKNIKINNSTLSRYIDKSTSEFNIPSINVANKITTTNENVSKIKFTNFEKSYNQDVMQRDTIKVLSALNEKSIPVYIKDIKTEDSSDELNYKETYKVTLEDENRVRHSLTFDVPKFIDDKFLYLNGSKKIITKQLFMKPIVKTGADEVQVCSNYNKIFIRRYGANMSPKIEKFKKTIASNVSGVIVKNGDASKINNNYKTTLEYDELSKSFISIKTNTVEFIFDQNIIHSRLKQPLTSDQMCIGFHSNGTPIIMTFSDEKIDGVDFIDYIVMMCGTKLEEVYDNINVSTKKFFFSRATIMAKDIPLILLLGYCEGITTVMKKANINHYFTDKRPKLTSNQNAIQFEDGYLVFDIYPLENSLLLNGLSIIPTKSFKYEELDSKDVYLELFDIMYRARNLSNAFDSFYEFMIDPITKEVLDDLDYPTDFVSVMIFANALLADNSYIIENNMNLYRVRSNEIVNAIIHRELADAYAAYRTTANSKNPTKISIPKDAIIKKILMTNTVEEFSTLNPIYESEKLRTISTKGVNGMNLERAYTLDKRSYDPTMMGIIGMSSSPDANVGVARKLALEPNIKGPRGYIDISDDTSKLNDVNIFTAAEMLTPMGNTHDESIRLAMASKQSGHIIPVAKSSPVLISNGVEQTIQYSLSKDFIITADDDGEVVEFDNDTGIMIVQYKDGHSQAVDTKPKVVKNSSSGFYISNKLNTKYKVGDKVKKNDILAYEDKFFTDDGFNGNRFNIGSLQKVAIMSAYSTYEDSTFVTNKLSKEMSSEIIMMKDVTIGRNANVDHIVNVGDEVHVGDILVSFETSYEDDTLNKFLASVGDDLQEEIKSLGKVPIKTKYSGIIEDIKIYSSVDLDELSPSLQKIVKAYYDKINKKKKIINKYDKSNGIIKAGMLLNEPTEKIKPTPDGKLKGKEVFDGVLIEFYIKYNDSIAVGDKITFYSALKSIVGEVIPEGYEPYSEFRPDEEISAFVGPSAVLQRMVPSIIFTMFGNKVLIELKNKLREIYEK